MLSVGDPATGRQSTSRIGPRVTPEQRVRAAAVAVPGAKRPGRAGTQEPGPGTAPGGRRSRHYAKHVSTALDASADQRVLRRHVRTAQREILWNESRLERVRKCGRVPIAKSGVRIRANADVAHYAGLATCGSVWACPMCSAKIRNTRAQEISEATARWDLVGNTVYMVTFTAPHDLGMRLRDLLPLIADGFRAVISGGSWIRIRKRLGVVGTIRSMEVTYGANGWHPHLHVLVYIDGELPAAKLAEFALYLRKRWAKFITSQGYRVPHEHHGVQLQLCESAHDAGLYIAKTQDGMAVGNELARADLKQGRKASRTPFEILDDFRWTGDLADLAVWHEYEHATKGHQAISWSKGLHAILGTAEEKTDEEVAAEEVGGEDLAVITNDVWRGVIGVPGLHAGLLDAAERGGLAAVNELLARHCVGWALAPPEPAPPG